MLAVHVKAGDKVEAGAPLLTIEAMKMETVMRAARASSVAEVLVQPRAAMQAGDLLAVLTRAPGSPAGAHSTQRAAPESIKCRAGHFPVCGPPPTTRTTAVEPGILSPCIGSARPPRQPARNCSARALKSLLFSGRRKPWPSSLYRT